MDVLLYRLPIDLIQNFSSKSICILLLFEDTEPENVSAIDSQIQPESHKNKCIGAISEMFSSLVKMKPPKPLEVVLSCNHWTQRNLPLQVLVSHLYDYHSLHGKVLLYVAGQVRGLFEYKRGEAGGHLSTDVIS